MTGTIRILHVDDDSAFADLTATYLERKDDRFAVTTALDPSEAFDRLTETEFDCIVSDYDMPGQSGIELLEAVREQYPDLPFILYTGKGSEAVASDAVSAGVTEYMQKESGTDQYTLLANRIANCVEQHRAEQVARETQERLQQLTENTTDCLWMFTSDWEELLFISGYEKVWNRPTERIQNNPTDFLEAIDPEYRDDAKQAMNRVADGEAIDQTLKIRGEDDDPRWVWVRGEPILNEEDDVIRVVGFTRDITDRQEHYEQLQQYETIVEALSDAVYVLDEKGQFVYVNDEFVEMVGYERDTILGSDPSLIKDESAIQTAEEQLGRLLSSDGPDDVTFEVAIQPREGAPIVCEDHMGVLPYVGDNFEGSVGTLRDVTPAKERERLLERQNDLFKKAQDIADVGAWSYDVQTDEAFLTDKVYEIHGLSPDDDLGPKESLSFYHPEDRPVIRDAFDRAIERGDSYDLELRLIDAADTLRWVRTRGDPEIEDGSVVSVRGTLQDITERKQQQREIEDRAAELEILTTELEEQYQHLFEEAPVMAVVTRAKQGRPIIEDCNDLFVETLGYEEAEIVGAELEDFYTAESQRKLLEEGGYERALSGEFVRENRELVTADGEKVETLLRAVPREDTKEDSRGTLAFYIDISERKRLERQRDRLEEFTSIVSHDLRSPLTVADGHIDLAQEECDSDHLARAADAVDRSQALIDDLLTLAREGEEVTGSETVALAEVAQSGWETVETRRPTLESDATGHIKADRSLLQQLFENLYRNAVEHGGDDVTVSVGATDEGFYVADTGPGIPESDREEVFEAGYSTNEDGTGFGLRIVKQIADAHEWEISVTESEGDGARFEITGVEKCE